MADVEEATLGLAEEVLTVDKRRVLTGRVRVKTETSEQHEIASIALDQENVEITRVPIDRVVTEAPQVRTDGDVTIIPILEEIAVVEKRLVLVEELHVRRTTTTATAELPVTLRKQHASIERQSLSTPRNTEEAESNE